MQLDLLRLRLTDADIKGALPQLLPPDLPVSDLTVAFTPVGIKAKGKYQTFTAVGFEAVVKVFATGAAIGVQLADLNAAGPLGGMFRGVLSKLIADHLTKYPGVEPANNGVIVNANALLQALGLESRLREVKFEPGSGEMAVEVSGSIAIEDAEKLRALRERRKQAGA